MHYEITKRGGIYVLHKSRVADMVSYRLMELAYLDYIKEEQETGSNTTAISLRLPKGLLRQIDYVADRLEFSRSDLIRYFLDMSVKESFEELKITKEEFFKISEEENLQVEKELKKGFEGIKEEKE